jgi:hypothetical protein
MTDPLIREVRCGSLKNLIYTANLEADDDGGDHLLLFCSDGWCSRHLSIHLGYLEWDRGAALD